MSQPQGKTIQIFLPDGNPRGVKIAGFTSGNLQVVVVPRAQLDFACSRKELLGDGLYFLFEEVGSEGKRVYVGETAGCTGRLKQWNKDNDWWMVALVCVSKTGEFTRSHVKFLERHCYQEATAVGRFAVTNSTVPTKSHVSESMEADLMDHFETIRILSGALGYPLFDHIRKTGPTNLLICKGKNAMAKGEYTEDGLVVFAKSIANRAATRSSSEASRATRGRLIEQGVLAPAGDNTYIFTKDHIFNSPSQAADIVLGRSANGWLEWEYSDRRTLDEVRRRSNLADSALDGSQSSGGQDLLTCQGAKGQYAAGHLIVLAKSIANPPTGSSSRSGRAMRTRLVDQGILSPTDNGTHVFTKDYEFTSPSLAADVVLGRSANGWAEWKYSDGRTLDQVKRKSSS